MRHEHGGRAAASLAREQNDPHIWYGAQSRSKIQGKGILPMTGNRKSSALGRVLDVFGSAILAATAVGSGHHPLDRDLARLGIDPREFRKIHRF